MVTRMTLADVTVLCYHRISHRPLPAGTWVGPGQLGRQLDALLAAGTRFLSPDDFHRLLPGPDQPTAGTRELFGSGQAVLLTFDDATVDLYRFRHILIDRDIRPLVFAPSAFLGRRNSWEWSIPGRRVRHLNAGQLRDLISAGWEIGLHGATHHDLTLLDPRGLPAEIDQARSHLEAAIARPVRYFSYPYGRTSPQVTERVRAAGFEAAFVLAGSTNGAKVMDHFGLFRRPVYCIDSARDVLAKVRDPKGQTLFGRWQRRKECGAHGVGRWTAELFSGRGPAAS